MILGIERAHVYPDVPEEPAPGAEEESVIAFESIDEHRQLIVETFGLDTDNPYRLTAADLAARRQEMIEARAEFYTTNRGARALGAIMLATVAQVEDEFRYQTFLDIGCGQGVLGQEMARKAKAKVTFLDCDRDILDTIPNRFGNKVKADGRNMDFPDESFRKVMSALSSIHWSETPVESVQALNEAIRVAEVGGSTFVIPLSSGISIFRKNLPLLHKSLDSSGQLESIDRGLAVLAMQDLSLISSLFKLAEGGYCAITWSNHVEHIEGRGNRELYSVIIDKLKSIPPEVYAQNLAFAQHLMADSQ